MTQETDEQTTAPDNQQKYRRLKILPGVPKYGDARSLANVTFEDVTGDHEFKETTSDTHKVRVKRREKNGRESFDVILYERITSKA